jgi:hypothetical protein
MSSRRRFYWLVGVGLLVLCFVPLALWMRHQTEWFYQARDGNKLVNQLRGRRPPDVSPRTWDLAADWAVTAYCNVCFSPGHVPLDELKRFRTELEERLRATVDLATVDWIWERLGRTGPHGRQYRERFEPEYREMLQTSLELDRRKQ